MHDENDDREIMARIEHAIGTTITGPKMLREFILDDDNNPVQCDHMTLIRWLAENEDRRVLGVDVISESEGIVVSTVFLGIDHNFLHGHDRPPLLFETMVFGGDDHLAQKRYATHAEAMAGHEEIVRAKRMAAGQ